MCEMSHAVNVCCVGCHAAAEHRVFTAFICSLFKCVSTVDENLRFEVLTAVLKIQRSSGMSHCIVGRVFLGVSENCSVFICTVTWSFKMSGNTHLVAQHHILKSWFRR
jgi:hypothetical protein